MELTVLSFVLDIDVYKAYRLCGSLHLHLSHLLILAFVWQVAVGSGTAAPALSCLDPTHSQSDSPVHPMVLAADKTLNYFFF